MTDWREPVALEVEPPERFSQTLLSKADVCEFSAALYVKHDGGVGSHPMERGSAFHAFAERWLKQLVAEELNVGEPEGSKPLLDEILRDDHLVPGPEQDGLRAMCFNFAELTWIDPSEVVAIEERFDVELAGRTVTGKIDLATISGALATISDWKTTFAIDPSEDFIGNFQTSVYAVALAEGKIRGEPVGIGAGLTQFDVRNVYPRYAWDAEGTMAYRSELIDYAAILDRKLYLERLVERTEKAFERGTFHAIPGSHCNTCPAASECPIPVELRNWNGDLTVDAPLEDAQKVATRWWLKKEGRAKTTDPGGPSIKADWEALKAWCSENGSLRFGADLILEYAPIEKEELRQGKGYGKEAFRAAIEAAVEFGQPFDWNEWHRQSVSTRLNLRTMSPHELEEEQDDRATAEAAA